MMITTKRLQILTGNEGDANQDPKDAASDASLIQQLQNTAVHWREWSDNESPLILGDEKRKVLSRFPREK